MDPNIFGVIGPGFLNQVPTLGLGIQSLGFKVFSPTTQDPAREQTFKLSRQGTPSHTGGRLQYCARLHAQNQELINSTLARP